MGSLCRFFCCCASSDDDKEKDADKKKSLLPNEVKTSDDVIPQDPASHPSGPLVSPMSSGLGSATVTPEKVNAKIYGCGNKLYVQPILECINNCGDIQCQKNSRDNSQYCSPKRS